MKITDNTCTNNATVVPQRGDIIKRESMFGTEFYILAKAYDCNDHVLINLRRGSNYTARLIPPHSTLEDFYTKIFDSADNKLTLIAADNAEVIVGGAE